jgi:hypothetical protein
LPYFSSHVECMVCCLHSHSIGPLLGIVALSAGGRLCAGGRNATVKLVADLAMSERYQGTYFAV